MPRNIPQHLAPYLAPDGGEGQPELNEQGISMLVQLLHHLSRTERIVVVQDALCQNLSPSGRLTPIGLGAD